MRAASSGLLLIGLGLVPWSPAVRADEAPAADSAADSAAAAVVRAITEEPRETPPPTITASISAASVKTATVETATSQQVTAAKVPHDPLESWSIGYLRWQPVLEAACSDCHQGEGSEGDFDLQRLTTSFNANGSILPLDRTASRTLARVLAQHEMPPADSSDLTAADRDGLVRWLESRPIQTGECNQIASDGTAPWFRGYVMSRRLTRAEYNNCIRDLTGLDYLRFQNDFPADGAGGEGFDTHGATLFTSPILMETLLAAANRTIEEAVPESREGVSKDRLKARGRILIAEPGPTVDHAVAARSVLHTFAERAWRRPAETEEVDRLVDLYRQRREAGLGFVAAVKMPLKAILLSPNFLFVAEHAPDDLKSAEVRAGQSDTSGVRRISGPEMAQRLAMFLWATMPDAELRRLAATEEIFEPEVLRQQVRRMLADRRSRGLAENFGLQWLGLTELTSLLAPDAATFPEFDPQLAEAMREEAVRLVLCVIQEDRPIGDLIDLPFTFVNPRLAEHYGIDVSVGDFADDDFARVPVDAASGRGGVLTLAGVLATTSYAHRTSPVLRGQWILDTVLGTPVEGPPAGVPPLTESDVASSASLRERMEQHRADPACAACHAKMDPLGFGLEAFDAIGRRRADDPEQPIDNSGTLPDGRRFVGAAELKALLLEREDEFAHHLSRKLMGYAMGRELDEFDDCTIDRATQALDRHDGRIGVLIEEIVLSFPFQNRYFKR